MQIANTDLLGRDQHWIDDMEVTVPTADCLMSHQSHHDVFPSKHKTARSTAVSKSTNCQTPMNIGYLSMYNRTSKVFSLWQNERFRYWEKIYWFLYLSIFYILRVRLNECTEILHYTEALQLKSLAWGCIHLH